MEPMQPFSGGSYPTLQDEIENPSFEFLQDLLNNHSMELLHRPIYLKRLVRFIPKEEAPAYAIKLIDYLMAVDRSLNKEQIETIERGMLGTAENIPLFDALYARFKTINPVGHSDYLIISLSYALRNGSDHLVEHLSTKYFSQTPPEELLRYICRAYPHLPIDRAISLAEYFDSKGFVTMQSLASQLLFRAIEYTDALQQLERTFNILESKGVALSASLLERVAGKRLLDYACRYCLQGCPELIVAKMDRATLKQALAPEPPYPSPYEECLVAMQADNENASDYAQFIQSLEVSLQM